MPEENLTQGQGHDLDQEPGIQSGGTELERATERVSKAMDAMKQAAEEVALKQESSEISLEQSAAAVLEAAGSLSLTVTALSKTLSDISFDETADKAALKKAMNVFTRAAGQLSKVSTSLSTAAAARKAAVRRGRPPVGAPSDQVPDDSELAKTAGQLNQTASAIGDATDSLSESMADLDASNPPDAHPKPPSDIALKDD